MANHSRLSPAPGLLALVIAAFLTTGCGGAGATLLPTVLVRPLPSTFNPAPSTTLICNDQLLEGTLNADPSDAWGAWVVTSGGGRVNVLWPPGFAISFDSPKARLLGRNGQQLATVGDPLRLGGGTADDPTTFGACEVNGVFYNSP
jgi:hypothetical protein